MAETPFMGELKLVAFNFPPKGWAQCDGQELQINQNQALFALLGTTYGGNGRTTFCLPDMRGRTPIHRGSANIQGEAGGEEAHRITQSEMPAHNHVVMATNSQGNSGDPSYLAKVSQTYGPAAGLTSIEPSTITTVGGSQVHNNLPPLLALNWCIALQGIFPSRD
jgi:microcystin-dependent protein